MARWSNRAGPPPVTGRDPRAPDPTLTLHARRRLQQRGLSERDVRLLCRFGRRRFNHDGTVTIHFDRDSRRRAGGAAGNSGSWRNAYLVQQVRSGLVLTVGHRVRRINR